MRQSTFGTGLDDYGLKRLVGHRRSLMSKRRPQRLLMAKKLKMKMKLSVLTIGQEINPVLAYSVKEAAGLLSLGRSTLYEFIKRGDGPRLVKFGGRTVIFADDLRTWAEAKRKAATGKNMA